jgi:multidrug resistance efflux pump
VLTLERSAEKEFAANEIEAVRLICELATARLSNLYDNNRWFGSRLTGKSKKFLSKLLGPTNTGVKVAVIVCFAVLLFLVFAKGMYKIKSPFSLEATTQQVIPAPFDGYLYSVAVEIDSVVDPVDVLGVLDTSELKLRLAAAKAEKVGFVKQAHAAMRDGQTAQAQIASANADKSSAEMSLLEYMIGQAKLKSPISGTVVKGDLKRQIGAPVKTGDILFEVASLDSLRGVLLVPEGEVFEVKVGQEGYLATASYPAERIKFIIERINPMAEVVEQRNVFKVRVKLVDVYPWMRPGMEGVAKVNTEKRLYVWIWTRKIVNWIRMKFWL